MSDEVPNKMPTKIQFNNNIDLINKYRNQLDEWQIQFIDLMLARFEITEKIWQIKVMENLQLEDCSREEHLFKQLSEQIQSVQKNKNQLKLNYKDDLIENVMMKIFQHIINENKMYLLEKLNLKVVDKKSSEN